MNGLIAIEAHLIDWISKKWLSLALLACPLVLACGGVETTTDDAAAIDAPTSTADAAADATLSAPQRVFVSAVQYPADFATTGGGILGANAACQTEATGQLQGTFVALIVTSSGDNAPAIIGDVINMNGDIVASGQAEFDSGVFRATNAVTPSLGIPADTVAWVGNENSSCSDWTTASARSSGGQGQTDSETFRQTVSLGPCSLQRSLQCISVPE